MSPDFKVRVREDVMSWKKEGVSAVSAARNLELLCGKANEDYGKLVKGGGRTVPEGQLLVEDVYDGTLTNDIGGAGLIFTPNHPPQTPPPPPPK